MALKPLNRMKELVDTQRLESEAAYFNALMYYGEMLSKITVIGLVSAVNEERERYQYRLNHRLVRATGIGERYWTSC